MKNIILLGSIFCIMTAFSQGSDENMDKSVRPQDDLYNYVNGSWMIHTEIPADKSRWGSYEELREKSDEECLKILNELARGNYAKGTEEQKVKDLYIAILDKANRNKNRLNPLLPYFDRIDKIQNKEMLQSNLEQLGLEGQNPLFQIQVSAHMKKSQSNALYFNSINLGLGRDYYQKNDEKSLKMLSAYTDYIAKLVYIIDPKNADKAVAAANFVQFEKALAGNMLTVEEMRNPDLRYNVIAVEEFPKMSHFFDLPAYVKSHHVISDSIFVPEKKYLQNLDQHLNAASIDFLKSFLKIKLLNNSMTMLSDDLDSISFEFYGKTLGGQKIQRSAEKRALETINSTYGDILGKIYVKKNFPPTAKKDALEMVNCIRRSFGEHIDRSEWMSNATKMKAKEKLSKITVKIGYTDKWKDYSKATVTSIWDGGNYFSNMILFRTWNKNDNLAKLKLPVDKREWGMTPQTVNAYYNPSNNEIVFPAAILQSPFFSPLAGPPSNFGGIGGVIGHEITHGFDDGGSKFDGDGNLNNWWTQEDKEKFESSAKALADEFSRYEPKPGVYLNGKFTLGENIADLGGLSVAYDAMKIYLHDKNIPLTVDRKKEFFQSWATIWRTKLRDQELIRRIKTDPHAPGYYRANGPITHIQGFYDAFDVQPSDKLYKEEKSRIKIW